MNKAQKLLFTFIYAAINTLLELKVDLNNKLEVTEKFDLITCTEVIEHLENPRLFLREIEKITAHGGKIIMTTPNPYSFLSLLSYTIKGYHSSFGPKDYPAHISPLSPYQLTNMISEIHGLSIEKLSYIPNGRIPGTGIRYTKLLPFLTGKRFSDNYCCVIRKS